jgi:hypothetical protein
MAKGSEHDSGLARRPDCTSLMMRSAAAFQNAMNGYLQAWSVESAGLTEQVLSLWKVVRTGRHRQNVDAVQASIRATGQDDLGSTHTRQPASSDSTENACGASEHGSEDGRQEGQGQS